MQKARLRAWRALDPRRLQVSVAVAVGLTLLVLRTNGVSQHFHFLGDQIRDWTVALGPWRDLPLSGSPNSIGGTGLGPAYYWLLWLMRLAIGPFTHNLPHAGAIGIALLNSVGDGLLLVAIWRRFGSAWLALAVVIVTATNPFDFALSGTIWTPPVAVAFVKMAMAIVLFAGDRPSLWHVAGATAAAWVAVQAHSEAIFVAVPMMAAFTLRELLARAWARAWRSTRVMAEVVLVLQIPLLVDSLSRPAVTHAPVGVLTSLAHAIVHPGSALLRRSARLVLEAVGFILMVPLSTRWLAALLAAAGIVTIVRMRRDPGVLAIAVVPPACLVLVLLAWQGPVEAHWCLAVMPCVVLTIGLAVTAAPWPAVARGGAIAMLVVALVSVPARLREAAGQFRLPAYGLLVRATRAVLRQTPTIRHIHTFWELPPSTDPEALYEMQGGRLSKDAPFVAIIERDGQVTYKLVVK